MISTTSSVSSVNSTEEFHTEENDTHRKPQVSKIEQKFRERYKTLQSIYEERLESLSQTFQAHLPQLIQSDEILHLLQENQVTFEYFLPRIEELVHNSLTCEREKMLVKLSDKLSRRKSKALEYRYQVQECAKRYQNLSQERKKLHDYNMQLQKQHDLLFENYENLEKEKESIRSRCSDAEGKNLELMEVLRKAESQLTELTHQQCTFEKSSTEFNELKDREVTLQESCAALQLKLKNNENHNTELTAAINEKSIQLEKELSSKVRLERKLKEKEDYCNKTNLDLITKENLLKVTQKELCEKEDQLKLLQKSNSVLEKKYYDVGIQIDHLMRETSAERDKDRSIADDRIKRLKEKMKEKIHLQNRFHENEISKLQDALKTLEKDIASKKKSLQLAEDNIADKEATITEKNIKLTHLEKELIESEKQKEWMQSIVEKNVKKDQENEVPEKNSSKEDMVLEWQKLCSKIDFIYKNRDQAPTSIGNNETLLEKSVQEDRKDLFNIKEKCEDLEQEKKIIVQRLEEAQVNISQLKVIVEELTMENSKLEISISENSENFKALLHENNSLKENISLVQNEKLIVIDEQKKLIMKIENLEKEIGKFSSLLQEKEKSLLDVMHLNEELKAKLQTDNNKWIERYNKNEAYLENKIKVENAAVKHIKSEMNYSKMELVKLNVKLKKERLDNENEKEKWLDRENALIRRNRSIEIEFLAFKENLLKLKQDKTCSKRNVAFLSEKEVRCEIKKIRECCQMLLHDMNDEKEKISGLIVHFTEEFKSILKYKKLEDLKKTEINRINAEVERTEQIKQLEKSKKNEEMKLVFKQKESKYRILFREEKNHVEYLKSAMLKLADIIDFKLKEHSLTITGKIQVCDHQYQTQVKHLVREFKRIQQQSKIDKEQIAAKFEREKTLYEQSIWNNVEVKQKQVFESKIQLALNNQNEKNKQKEMDLIKSTQRTQEEKTLIAVFDLISSYFQRLDIKIDPIIPSITNSLSLEDSVGKFSYNLEKGIKCYTDQLICPVSQELDTAKAVLLSKMTFDFNSHNNLPELINNYSAKMESLQSDLTKEVVSIKSQYEDVAEKAVTSHQMQILEKESKINHLNGQFVKMKKKFESKLKSMSNEFELRKEIDSSKIEQLLNKNETLTQAKEDEKKAEERKFHALKRKLCKEVNDLKNDLSVFEEETSLLRIKLKEKDQLIADQLSPENNYTHLHHSSQSSSSNKLIGPSIQLSELRVDMKSSLSQLSKDGERTLSEINKSFS